MIGVMDLGPIGKSSSPARARASASHAPWHSCVPVKVALVSRSRSILDAALGPLRVESPPIAIVAVFPASDQAICVTGAIVAMDGEAGAVI